MDGADGSLTTSADAIPAGTASADVRAENCCVHKLLNQVPVVDVDGAIAEGRVRSADGEESSIEGLSHDDIAMWQRAQPWANAYFRLRRELLSDAELDADDNNDGDPIPVRRFAETGNILMWMLG